MDDSIGNDHQYHVLLYLVFHLLAHAHGLSKQRGEVSRSWKRKIRQTSSVALYDAIQLKKIRIVLVSV